MSRHFLWPLALSILFPLTTEAKAVPSPLSFEEIGDETYTEQLTAIADLEDGSYVKVRLGVSNVGPGDGKGACELMVISKDGTKWSDEKIVDREERTYDAGAERLKIGPCEAVGQSTLVMRAALPSGTVEIRLEAPPKRQKAHEMKDGDAFYSLDVIVPWAKAKVTLQKDGKKRTLSGHGYADHSRSRILPQDLAKRWLRFRGLEEKDPRLVLVRFPAKGPPVGWHMSKGGRTELNRVMLAPKGGAKKPVWRARFKGTSGEWRIVTGELLHRNAPIESQGVLGSLIRAAVGNPVTYTFRGVLEERGTGKRVRGLVEVTLTNETTR